MDPMLMCKGNDYEKGKEKSYEEDNSTATNYTPMNFLELTTTNLNFQALTVSLMMIIFYPNIIL
jgi:hypothetical protein